ncbi:MAG: PAS domain-containing protein [Betaproteobacteria bacterium]|nr:PAS domain-containing protein [Betaproteobacteria bacterium]
MPGRCRGDFRKHRPPCPSWSGGRRSRPRAITPAGSDAGRYREATEQREPFALDYRLRRADGIYRWAVDAGKPRFDETGRLVGFVGAVFDIDDRKRAEQALRETEAHLVADLRAQTLLHELSARLVQRSDLEPLLAAILAAAAETAVCSAC